MPLIRIFGRRIAACKKTDIPAQIPRVLSNPNTRALKHGYTSTPFNPCSVMVRLIFKTVMSIASNVSSSQNLFKRSGNPLQRTAGGLNSPLGCTSIPAEVWITRKRCSLYVRDRHDSKFRLLTPSLEARGETNESEVGQQNQN